MRIVKSNSKRRFLTIIPGFKLYEPLYPATLAAALLCPLALAQPTPPTLQVEQPLTDATADQLLDVKRYTAANTSARSAAIAPPDIDRMVFNRLLREIMDDPDQLRRTLALSREELPELSLLLSNSLQYTNIDHARAHQQMCRSWQMNRRADDRREQALAAYDASIARDKRYIAERDRRLLVDIEALLSPIGWEGFRDYMEDRRRRLATVRSLSDHGSARAKGLTQIEISNQCGHRSP